MRIGLNGQKITCEKPAGPELYTINIYKALAAVDKDNEYVVYFPEEPKNELWTEISNNNKNFSYKVLEKRLSWTQFNLGLELIKNPVDLFFSPVHTVPFISQKLRPKIKFVNMIHGLEYSVNQENTGLIVKLLHKPLVINWVVKTAGQLVVPSKYTRDQILNNFGQNLKNKITVIPEGVDSSFYKRNYDEVENAKNKYGIKGDYLFFLSTIQPRKNIPNMIEAFSKFVKSNQKYKNLKLVVSGKKGWNYEDSMSAPKKFGIEGNVIFTGRIDQSDLPALFSGAKAYINMSVEEGFGLTVLEAMACACPLLISDIPAHKEIGGSYGNYANPYNVEEISKAIENVIEKPDMHKIEYALNAARTFTWDNSALKLLSLFEKVK